MRQEKEALTPPAGGRVNREAWAEGAVSMLFFQAEETSFQDKPLIFCFCIFLLRSYQDYITRCYL